MGNLPIIPIYRDIDIAEGSENWLPIEIKQGSNEANSIVINVFENSIEYPLQIDDDITYLLLGKRTDGGYIFRTGTASGNSITFEHINTYMTCIAGEYKLSVSIIDKNNTVNPLIQDVYVNIIDNPFYSSNVVDTDEYSALIFLVNKSEELVVKLQQQVDEMEIIKAQYIENEENRQRQEEVRQLAETVRQQSVQAIISDITDTNNFCQRLENDRQIAETQRNQIVNEKVNELTQLQNTITENEQSRQLAETNRETNVQSAISNVNQAIERCNTASDSAEGIVMGIVPHASAIPFDGTNSGSSATFVQGAIDELFQSYNECFQFGSEKKSILVSNLTAMGINCSLDDSWDTLLSYVLTIFTGTDVSGTTAVAADVVEGKKFYDKDGNLTIGNIKSRNRNAIAINTNWDKTNKLLKCNIPCGAYLDSVGNYSPIDKFTSINITKDALRNIITEDNIKFGSSICGFDGTYTSDATATVNDIASGKTAYVKGQLLTGTAVLNNGKKYATGTLNGVTINSVLKEFSTYSMIYEEGSGVGRYTDSTSHMRYITITCDFVPSMIVFTAYAYAKNGYINGIISNNAIHKSYSGNNYNCSFIKENNRIGDMYYANTTIGTTTIIPYSMNSSTVMDITWYAYE